MNDPRKWIYILLARSDQDDEFCVFDVYSSQMKAERALEEEIRTRVETMGETYITETTYEAEEKNFQLCQFPLPAY